MRVAGGSAGDLLQLPEPGAGHGGENPGLPRTRGVMHSA